MVRENQDITENGCKKNLCYGCTSFLSEWKERGRVGVRWEGALKLNGRIQEIVRSYISWQIYESAFLPAAETEAAQERSEGDDKK